MSSPPADHAARLAALELADEVARALESEPTFARRLDRLAAALAPCRVEALDGEGQPLAAGEPVPGGRELALTAAGQRFGTLIVEGRCDAPEAVAARAAALLEALGHPGGQALERALLYVRQQRATDRLQRLQATTEALGPQEVAATAAEQGREALGADSAWVALLDESRRALEPAHAEGALDVAELGRVARVVDTLAAALGDSPA